MLQTRKETGNLEGLHLAPYAMKSVASKGRAYPETPHPYRTDFQRDRDRILHSRCFRRLEYKTQVFVNGTADHYRTRMTHTFEMTAVGRTLARALSANEDLTECIGLAHDIGHSPFGHSGEESLDELMKEHGGFDHNEQSVRLVETLEKPYPSFDGLNLTWEVRAGLRKHQAHLQDKQVDGLPIGPHQQLEAQIADIADDITYHAHDIDDGLYAGLLTNELLNELEIWRMASHRTQQQHAMQDGRSAPRLTVRNVLDIQVEDILKTSSLFIEKHSPNSPDQVMNCPVRLVTYSPQMREIQDQTRAFLFKNLYFHPSVIQANKESAQMMSSLFQFYIEHPEHLGSMAQCRVETDGLWRAACDYVSGMTDRYALHQCKRFKLD